MYEVYKSGKYKRILWAILRDCFSLCWLGLSSDKQNLQFVQQTGSTLPFQWNIFRYKELLQSTYRATYKWYNRPFSCKQFLKASTLGHSHSITNSSTNVNTTGIINSTHRKVFMWIFFLYRPLYIFQHDCGGSGPGKISNILICDVDILV